MNLNCCQNTVNNYSFNMGGISYASMVKMFYGWLVEVSNGDDTTIFYWTVSTARAAFIECYRFLRRVNHV